MTKHVPLTYSPSLADERASTCIVDLDEISSVLYWPNSESHLNFKNGDKFSVKESPLEIFTLMKSKRKKK